MNIRNNYKYKKLVDSVGKCELCGSTRNLEVHHMIPLICAIDGVDLEDDGRVTIYHTDKEVIAKTRQMLEDITREVEEGKLYTAKVVKIEEFGCFVQVWPGCEGLVHISELSKERVEKTEDVVSLGDEIVVKCIGWDKKGRLNFSRKKVFQDDSKNTNDEKKTKKESKKETESKEDVKEEQ
jgi:polyribonucleotide nucleotidyltransferase